ncbi:carbon catabolite repressor protein 4-like protein 5 isoform X2 [Iris pallida]|uniref:Carbon catabolite repressor protein 4-like protein 5 isoform X2 n=1 Tax=Iris pallida TaxID=29817 RepID=A0AAX6DNT5_IRIPA|nr:carbon catabolite repressor protein 4-like protein 5 isoform X2 [Iris pallida]
MKATNPGPNHAGSRSEPGRRKRKHEHDASRSSRRDSSRSGKRRRTSGGDGTRRWVCSPRDASIYKSKFTIVSYNILGVKNVSNHSDLYHRVSPENLKWDHRKRRIRKELNRYNPSIICFQEVDRFDDLTDLLRKDGYVGVHKARTGDASDGCAIFWKEEQFALLHQEDIEYRKYGLRDNVAQLCMLKTCHNYSTVSTSKDANSEVAEFTPSQTLLVGNIHVLFNPNRGDVKLGQIRLLLDKAFTMSQQWGNSPVVICGDFNSTPQSAVHHFLSSPELDILLYDRKKISGQIELPAGQVPFSTQSIASRSRFGMPKLLKYRWSQEEIHLAGGSRECTCLKNPLKLLSAYQGVPGHQNTRDCSGEPLATSYHSKFMGTVDYIWHSAALVPLRVVETLPIKCLKSLGGLPSEKWGSDHLSLVCELAFIDDANHANSPLCSKISA